MDEIIFDFDWEDPGGAKGAELNATWARLNILVRGESVTTLLDTDLKSVRDNIYLPLYPLAEWITFNWWNLLSEPLTPSRSTEVDFFYRHSLVFAREGFSLTNLTMRSIGDKICFDWRSEVLEHHNRIFLKSGSACVAKAAVERALAQLIESVIERLRVCGISDSTLEKEWESITSLTEEEELFCETAASLGLDPFDLTEDDETKILATGSLVPESLRTEFFEAADFNILERQAKGLNAALIRAISTQHDLVPLKQIRERAPKIDLLHTPWEQGYEFAHHLRGMLGIGDHILKDLDAVSDALKTNSTEFKSAIMHGDSAFGLFDALVGINPTGNPGFVIGKSEDAAQRFAICRGLFEYLVSENGTPLLITKTRSERQKRNRAFAAEFLAPADFIRRQLKSRFITEEKIEELAEELNVSPLIVRHQIKNHRIAEHVPETT